LKARLKVKSSGRLSNYTRRPTPEGYLEMTKKLSVPIRNACPAEIAAHELCPGGTKAIFE
ncbi:hypothetical protein, partial [Bradyrhizobium jicamae]|uniref:hypothetical protein n=1 Tax=Bradyrhizobium jicamae TaxID=280332 RepID=UPI001BA9A820